MRRNILSPEPQTIEYCRVAKEPRFLDDQGINEAFQLRCRRLEVGEIGRGVRQSEVAATPLDGPTDPCHFERRRIDSSGISQALYDPLEDRRIDIDVAIHGWLRAALG